MMKVVAEGDYFLVVDTDTHRIIGRHLDKRKAEKHRRWLRQQKRKNK